MITKCYFDDDKFIDRNRRMMIVSDDIGEKGRPSDVKIEIFTDGNRESVVVVDGKELAKAIANCTRVDPWGEF